MFLRVESATSEASHMKIGDNELETRSDESSGDHEERSDELHNSIF